MVKADKIISASWLFTAHNDDQLKEDHSVVVSNGIIHDIVPTSEVFGLYDASDTYQLTDHVLLPGFINAHTHAAMTIFKGFADDLALQDWLNNYIWPAEKEFVNYDFVRDGSTHAIAEMIKGGTTTFNDMYFFPEATAEVVGKIGIRANIGLVLLEFPTNYAKDPREYLNKGLEFRDNWRDNPLITTSLAPHAPYSVSDESFEMINTYAEQLDLTIHSHIHETLNEIDDSKKQFGCSPIERLSELGILSPRLMAAHCVHLSNNDINLLSNNGVSILSNISSNMKLGSGLINISELFKNEMNIAIGTDSSASNNRLDILTEMRSLALISKALTMKSEFLNPSDIIKMATINGAKALNIDDFTGSIAKGKSADIIAFNLDSIETQPCYDPLSSFLYCAHRQSCSYVWINGEIKLKENKLVCIDESEILQKAKAWKNRIKT